MTIDRERIARRIIDIVQHGYSTHRVSQKILVESLTEAVNALIDELEKLPVDEGPRPPIMKKLK